MPQSPGTRLENVKLLAQPLTKTNKNSSISYSRMDDKAIMLKNISAANN